MAIWIAKAMAQKCISFLPFKHDINYIFQKHITKGARLTDELFISKLNHCRQHIDALINFTPFGNNYTALELGTGWYPIIPLGLFLHGADRIYTADIKSTLSADNISLTMHKFILYYDQGILQKYIPDIKAERIQAMKELYAREFVQEDFFSLSGIRLLLGDITKQNIHEEKIQLINSNNTFEHIPPAILKQILIKCRSMIDPEGIMSHFIDLSDHFSHLDDRITNYNFLKFSSRQWKLIDNSIQPQNRLRISHYREILQEARWKIIQEDSVSAQAERLKEIKPDILFSKISDNDLAVTHSLLLCKPV